VRVTGFELSGFSFPFRKKEIKMGVKEIARKASMMRIKVLVHANG
jgi:hypothetical protein